MTSWTCDVTYLDGTVVTVESVTRERVADGVLSLHRRETQYGPDEEHLGSWPLVNIQTWKRMSR